MKKAKRVHRLTDHEFAELRSGAEEALAHARGGKITLRTREAVRRAKPPRFTPERIRSVRRRLNVSQPVFAELLCVSKDTAAKWEQGLRQPSGSALRLLEIVERRPDVLIHSTDSSDGRCPTPHR